MAERDIAGIAWAHDGSGINAEVAPLDNAEDGHDAIRTACGRCLTIGQLRLDAPAHPMGRVTMRVGCKPYDHDELWVSLTPDESRQLARHLLAHAETAERQYGAPRTAGTATNHGPERLPKGQIDVTYVSDSSYSVHVREHHVLVDQPFEDGGHGLAATPTELLVASHASSVAFSVGRYLAMHGFTKDGLTVTARFEMAPPPARVASVHLRVRVPAQLSPECACALQAVASHCTVHSTLQQPPQIDFQFG